MEAPTTLTRTSNTDRSLDVHTLGPNSEGEVVETVTGSTHLPDEELPKWRALLYEREHHDSSGEKLFNPVAADEPWTVHGLRRHQCSAAHRPQQQLHLYGYLPVCG